LVDKPRTVDATEDEEEDATRPRTFAEGMMERMATPKEGETDEREEKEDADTG
jgi:hypothetical protein